jgi:hypothetical protein
MSRISPGVSIGLLSIRPAGRISSSGHERELPGAKATLHGIDEAAGAVFTSVIGEFDPAAVQRFLSYYNSVNPFREIARTLPDGKARATARDFSDDF